MIRRPPPPLPIPPLSSWKEIEGVWTSTRRWKEGRGIFRVKSSKVFMCPSCETPVPGPGIGMHRTSFKCLAKTRFLQLRTAGWSLVHNYCEWKRPWQVLLPLGLCSFEATGWKKGSGSKTHQRSKLKAQPWTQDWVVQVMSTVAYSKHKVTRAQMGKIIELCLDDTSRELFLDSPETVFRMMNLPIKPDEI